MESNPQQGKLIHISMMQIKGFQSHNKRFY